MPRPSILRRSLVIVGETGFLAPADDADGFARHITALAQDGALRRRLGEAARTRALRFSWEETLARMLGYYRALSPNIDNKTDDGNTGL